MFRAFRLTQGRPIIAINPLISFGGGVNGHSSYSSGTIVGTAAVLGSTITKSSLMPKSDSLLEIVADLEDDGR